MVRVDGGERWGRACAVYGAVYDARLSHAMPEKPGRHVHEPVRPLQLPLPEHVMSSSCGDAPAAGFGFARHATPTGHVPGLGGGVAGSGA